MKKNYYNTILKNTTKKGLTRKIAIILGAIIIGLICIIISSFFSSPWEKYDNWRILVNTILSTIATVSFASVAWEGIAKYAFSRDVIDMVGLSDKIVKSGVFAIEKSFSDIEWDELLNGAKSITAIFSYSTKWGKDNRESIIQAVENGCHLVVVLPDIKAPGVLDALNFRFAGVDNIERKINEAKTFYQSLGAEIKNYPKTIQSSYYLVDDIGIMVPFNHQKEFGGHTPSVPAVLALKKGYIYEYINEEVSAILQDAKRTI